MDSVFALSSPPLSHMFRFDKRQLAQQTKPIFLRPLFYTTQKMQVRDAFFARCIVSKPKISNKSVRVGPQQETSSWCALALPHMCTCALRNQSPKLTASFSTRVCSESWGCAPLSLCRGGATKTPISGPYPAGITQ
jgi:hypothetical protein